MGDPHLDLAPLALTTPITSLGVLRLQNSHRLVRKLVIK